MRGKYGNIENKFIVARRIRAWLCRNIPHKTFVSCSKRANDIFIISWKDGLLIEELEKEVNFFLGHIQHSGERTYILHGRKYKAVRKFEFKRIYSKTRYDILSGYLDERLGTKNILPVQYQIMERDLIRQRLLK